MNAIYNCINCGKTLAGKQRSFCSNTCKNGYYQDYERLKQRANSRKKELAYSLGDKCVFCGFRKLDALSFYHKSGVSLGIDINELANCKLEKLLAKAEGAILVCRNCHATGNNLETIPNKHYKSERNKILEKFTQNMELAGIKANDKVILGVSGGVDSVTMLDLFTKSALKKNVIIAHLNHNVRKDADADEHFVEELAKKYDLPFFSKKLQPMDYSSVRKNTRMGNNIEEHLRDERRSFLLEIGKNQGAKCIALAHNADDQAETFFMNALRGSGPAGLGAMEMRDEMIFRPLLTITREEIEQYARENQLEWHEDITNKDITFTRNYIRHEILPLLYRINPDYLANIGRTASLQRNIDNMLKDEANEILKQIQDDVKVCESLPKPVLYEAFGLLYEKAKGDRKNLSLRHLQKIEKMVTESDGTKTLDLPGEIIARRTYNHLDFTKKMSDNVAPETEPKSLKTGELTWGKWRFKVLENKLGETTAGKNEICLDNINNIVVRTQKPGDRITSKGLTGRKRLQDLFVDAKIDKEKRASWPVFTDLEKDEIIWIPELAVAKQIIKEKNRYIIKVEKDKDEIR